MAVFNLTGGGGAGLGPAALLVVPIIANEFFLAGWLIVKGFDRTALEPTSTAVPA